MYSTNTMPTDEQQFLPKERLDLPKPHEALPQPKQESSSVSVESPLKHEEESKQEVKTLLSWHAPGRPFRARNRSYFVNILILMLVINVILFLFSQYLLMLVVISLVFVNYALTTVPPHDFRYKISNQGVTIEEHFYLWQELYDFYFKRQEHQDVLILRTKSYIPGELVFTLGEMSSEHVKNIIVPYLPYREFVPPSSMEKAGEWLSKTFPLEHTRKT